MDDLISRRAAIKAIDDLPNCYNGYSDTYDKAYIIGTLEELPSIDAVPVVRCRDCNFNYGKRHGGEFNPEDIVCYYWETGGLYADDFCSYGEGREDATD